MRWRPVRGAAKRWTGVRAGQPSSREISHVWGADAVEECGRQHRRSAVRESPGGPTRSENLSMREISMRENRETPWSPDRLISDRAAQGRQWPHAWDARCGESYSLVVPAKRRTKPRAADPHKPERRRRWRRKGGWPRNTAQQGGCPDSGPERNVMALDRVRREGYGTGWSWTPEEARSAAITAGSSRAEATPDPR
jgi:hypothetical protein